MSKIVCDCCLAKFDYHIDKNFMMYRNRAFTCDSIFYINDYTKDYCVIKVGEFSQYYIIEPSKVMFFKNNNLIEFAGCKICDECISEKIILGEIYFV